MRKEACFLELPTVQFLFFYIFVYIGIPRLNEGIHYWGHFLQFAMQGREQTEGVSFHVGHFFRDMFRVRRNRWAQCEATHSEGVGKRCAYTLAPQPSFCSESYGYRFILLSTFFRQTCSESIFFKSYMIEWIWKTVKMLALLKIYQFTRVTRPIHNLLFCK